MKCAHTETFDLSWGATVCTKCHTKVGNCEPTHQQPDYYPEETEEIRQSVYRGVYFDKHQGKWKSSLYYAGNKFPTGCFRTEEEALAAYNKMALKVGAYHKLQEVKL